MNIALICAVILGSYLFGNINTALIISKIKNRDVRKEGSGNPGTMNMLRNFGVKLGALTLVLDVIKGALPTLIGWLILGDLGRFTGDKIGAYIGGLSVIVGHIFPAFLKFKGGKGVASCIGVCLIIDPIATLIMFALGVSFIFITKMGSVTSFIIISVPLIIEGFRVSGANGNVASLILIYILFALVLFAHRKNVCKLFAGTESKTIIIKHKQKKV